MSIGRRGSRYEREALDPDTPAERLLELVRLVPEHVLENPALPLHELASPSFFLEMAGYRASQLYLAIRALLEALPEPEARAFGDACAARAEAIARRLPRATHGESGEQLAQKARAARTPLEAAFLASQVAALRGPAELLAERRWQLETLEQLRTPASAPAAPTAPCSPAAATPAREPAT